MKLDTTQKVTTQSGIEQENALLNESAAMESSLTLQIIELEGETKQVLYSYLYLKETFIILEPLQSLYFTPILCFLIVKI